MDLVNIFDYEAHAGTHLDAGTWAYFAGGSDDEVTLRANRMAFEQMQICPRVLVDVSTIDMKTAVQGIPVTMPIVISPVGFQGLAHAEGECATAQASGSTGTLMIVSAFSSRTLEEIAEAATGPLWFQLSAPDRGWTERLVQRAMAAGYRALVITVDAARNGHKERIARQDFHLPAYKANFGDVPMGNNFTALPTWAALSYISSYYSQRYSHG